MREHLFRAQLSRAIQDIECMDPVVDGLTPEQLAAVHVMKHEVLAAVHRLYMHVPPPSADHLLSGFIGRLPQMK